MQKQIVDVIADEIRDRMLELGPKLMDQEAREAMEDEVAAKHGYTIVHRGRCTEGFPVLHIEKTLQIIRNS